LEEHIRSAFVYGSVAKAQERASSDVDLIVIGDLTLLQLSPTLTDVETKLRRPVNATVYSVDEFVRKIAGHNHFLQAVLAADKIFLLGTADELEQLAERGSNRSARREQS
jgi:hypothetical protein